MRHLTDTLLATLIPLAVLLHLVLSPYSKVEESFNLQAAHDILTYGFPIAQVERNLRDQYDHLTFTGPVPRTFVGPLALAAVAWPGAGLVEGVNRQILVRAVLGLFNAFCLLSFRNGVLKAFGRNAANWFVVFQAGQFHLMYYASRTLPNFFAFGLTTLALRDLLPVSETTFSQSAVKRRYKRALILLTVTGVVFRSEIALLVGTHTLHLVIFKRRTINFFNDMVPSGLLGLLIGLFLTVPLDSYFWLRSLLWPELSAFSYNVLDGHASNWGTSLFHFYFTSAIPRLFFNPFTYQICLPFAISRPAFRTSARDILLPNLAFVILYSFQPHKEWRFIIYIIPPILALAAAGAEWIWARRAKSLTYRVLALGLIGSSVASFGASFLMLAVSRLNYPGAEALMHLHHLHAQEGESQEVVRVHMDTSTCMTGVTRFLQIPPSPSDGLGTGDEHDGVMWIYDKSEDATSLLHPGFWDQFDYVLTEQVETVIGKWEVAAVVYGYAGIKVVRPGEVAGWGWGSAGEEKDVKGWELRWRIRGLLGGLEHWGRKFVTRGRWLGLRMEPRIRILKKQRESMGV